MDLTERYRGCLIGLAAGDALGSPFEFWVKGKVIKYLEDNELELLSFQRGDENYPAGFYTDDTALTLCLAESLVEKGFSLEDQFQKYRKWLGEGYMTPLGFTYGVGQQTFRALNRELRDVSLLDGSNEKEGGNGSLMRCVPLGLYYQGNLDNIKEKSLLASYITHNNLIAGWSCVVLNATISLILEGKKKEEIIKLVLEHYSNSMPRAIWECLVLDYRAVGNKFLNPISGYSLDTLRIALWSWQTSENFESSIKKVIALGNDTDTFAAVTGAITGCYYGYTGIPKKWREGIMNKEIIIKSAHDIFEKIKQI